MKKKIVAISGSPSKGWNSDTMLDAFIEGAQKNDTVEIKKFYATDIECENYCFINKNGAKEHEVALQELFDAIEDADGLVIATPTYNFSVPAGLKNIIDRMRPIALDMQKINALKQPTGKLSYIKTFFVVSGGSPIFIQKILFLLFPPFWLSIVFKYYGAQLGGSVYGGSLSGSQIAKNDTKLLKKIKNAGAKYAKNL